MIILYSGSRGSGKTLSMVKDSQLFASNGFKIYRNFPANVGEFLSTDDIISLDKDSNLKDCVILIDEIQILFDSRTSLKLENRNFSHFLQQIRKRNIIILCTTQYSNTVDLRLRQHIDILACPRFDIETEVCAVTYYDLSVIGSLLTDLLHPSLSLCSFTLIFYAPAVYPLYDTYHMIA